MKVTEMAWGPLMARARLKSRHWLKRIKPQVRVEPVNDFYKRHWTGEEPSPDRFICQNLCSFFFTSADFRKYREALKLHFADSCDRIISRASDVVNNRFNFLGTGDLLLDEDLDWHVDFKSGKRWPVRHYSRLPIADVDGNKDVKIPWELSRLQFFTNLGRAYWLTGDDKYAEKFKTLLSDWEKKNPVDKGINWTCSMEVAIRAINIIWGIYFFAGAETIDDEFVKNTIKLLYYHGLHIENNLEEIYERANTNHLIADYLGLFYLGVLFPEFDRSEGWRSRAIDGLQREIEVQVYPDGADYECSTSYHRLKLEMFLSAFILGRINSVEFNSVYKDRLHHMIHFSAAITAPSGKTPLIGDNDDGYVVKLSAGDPADHGHLMDVGSLIFGEKVPGDIPVSQERLWYLGIDSLVPYSSGIAPKSRWFKDSGFVVIRNRNMHMVFSAIKASKHGLSGHKHNDLLSFTLEIDKIPFLIDPGTFCYTADYGMRNLSRSTQIHNTVMVDGVEQNRFFEKRLFYMSPDADPKVNLWVNVGSCAVVSASHNGYKLLDDDVLHKRSIWVSLANCTLLILDEFTGASKHQHTFDQRFITSLEQVERAGDSNIVISSHRAGSLTIGPTEDEAGELIIERSFCFPRYGIKKPANIIRYSYKSKMPFKASKMICYSSAAAEGAGGLKIRAENLEQRFREVGVGISS
jgi:hypothetical protein